MGIAFYNWAETDQETKARILRRSQANIDDVVQVVLPIIADVKERGDAALKHYAQKFEGAEISSIKATPEEFDAAEGMLDDDLKAAIKYCANNVRTFHEEQMRRADKDAHWMVEIAPGIMAGEQTNAIESVGLYIPRGKGAFPSALYMLAIPAVIAGVKDIAVVTPPTPDGMADAATLYTARLCGVENVYKCGGAQAIAALAYGTQSVPAVKKVVGPGSPYVAAAKQVLSNIMDAGMPAGPSDAIVLCDEHADAYNTCLDILNEAEHGEDSAVLLITHDATLAEYVRDHLQDVIDELPEPHKGICQTVFDAEQGYGGIVLTESLEASITLSNKYAAEHLHLKVRDAENVCRQIKHAGEVLIGENTPSTLGNYGIGVNHVLPTGGWAHTYSCTSVWDFLKRTSISKVDKSGFDALKKPVLTLTDYEDFPMHGDVLRKRNIF